MTFLLNRLFLELDAHPGSGLCHSFILALLGREC
jgi:hypothetical protein